MSTQRTAVFLDRDGTINEEVEFLTNPADLHLIPGAGTAIRKLNASGIVTCVISNQSGIARGFLSEEDLVPIHAKLTGDLAAEGATLDRFYICPHHPTEGNPPYKKDCDCRKPKPGMLLLGKQEFDLNLEECFVVGDRLVDINAGKAVHATTILVRTGYGKTAESECTATRVRPDGIVDSIVEAVELIFAMMKDRKRN